MSCSMKDETLAAFSAGDLAPPAAAAVEEHAARCARCRARLDALRQTDALLAGMQRTEPPAAAVLGVRRALAKALGGPPQEEVMTLPEVAEFLKLTQEELGEIVEELPAFELAGQVRIRRSRLVAWIEKREQDYTRAAVAGWAADALQVVAMKGVA